MGLVVVHGWPQRGGGTALAQSNPICALPIRYLALPGHLGHIGFLFACTSVSYASSHASFAPCLAFRPKELGLVGCLVRIEVHFWTRDPQNRGGLVGLPKQRSLKVKLYPNLVKIQFWAGHAAKNRIFLQVTRLWSWGNK